MNNIKRNVIHMSDNKKFKGFKFNDHTYSETELERSGEKLDNNNSNETLFQEIKLDMREREERSRREISEREERFEKQLKHYAESASAREEKLSAEFKEREERILATLNKLETNIATQSQHVETMKTQSFWGSLALFVGMLAIVITLIIAVLA